MAPPPKPKTNQDWISLNYEIGSLFTGAPIAEEELFAGRGSQVRQMLEAVLDRARHVVLYGEKGVGKTSITNIFWKRYNKMLQTVIVARVQADPSDSFSSLWIKALEELQSVGRQMGREELVPIDTDYETISPDNIRRELQKCRANAIPIIIIDEFDKLRDRSARELTSHVIKSLYDYSETINTTVILVGVAEDIVTLIQDHKSIDRALSQVKLERMTTAELNEILDRRFMLTPIRMDGDARWSTITLSRGLPYYVHMLGKFAAQNAVQNRRIVVSTIDVDAAMDKLLAEGGQSFQDDYRKATQSNQADNLFKQVLLACALADPDDSGFFTPTNVIDPLNAILNKPKRHAHIQRHLGEFIHEKRGCVLVRRGDARQHRYRFTDPMMQPFVIMKGIRENMVDASLKSKLLYREQLSLPTEL
jgi:Cdc6-like AAA superfamily ATPase